MASAALYGWLDADGRLRDNYVRQHPRLDDLAAEQTTFSPSSSHSPDRLDGLYHGLKYLLADVLADRPTGGVASPHKVAQQQASEQAVSKYERGHASHILTADRDAE